MAYIDEAAMAPFSPIKPGIPKPAWVDEIASSVGSGNAVFKGSFTYQDTEAGIVLNDLKAKGYYIQHTRNGVYSADSNIRAYYNDELIITNILPLDTNNQHSTAEMFIRNGMWVCQSTQPVANLQTDSIVENTFARAMVSDEPFITDLILGTSGATSGIYRVWLYE